MSSSSDDEILNYFNELLGEPGDSNVSDEVECDGANDSANLKGAQNPEALENSKEPGITINPVATKKPEKTKKPENSEENATANEPSLKTIQPQLLPPVLESANIGLSQSSISRKIISTPSTPEKKFYHTKGATSVSEIDRTELALLEQQKKKELQALLDRGFERKAFKPAPASQEKTVQEVQDPVQGSAQVSVKDLAVEVRKSPVQESQKNNIASHDLENLEPTSIERSQNNAETNLKDLGLLAWGDNGRPQWAQSDFDALLFKVAGLKLAVPLVCLGQIYPIDENLSQIFGQAEWFMGVQATPLGKLRIVNTALFVMPEKYKEEFLESASYVVSINGLQWALAVDTVEQPIKLQPHDVTWRSQRGKRPWLAGTVKSAMCALIDIPNMGEMLEKSDKNRI